MVLFLLNPGRQSRHYMLGLVRAAERMGLAHVAVELGPIWDYLAQAADKRSALMSVHAELARLVRARGVTDAIGYVYNGTFDIGLASRPGQVGRGLFPSLGVRHILLWTDHPEWASEGLAIRAPMVDVLRDPLMVHVLKSKSAAAEAREVLQWPNVMSMPMAEDHETMRPARGVEAVHDIVVMLGDARGFSPAVARFLDVDDPEPREIDDAKRGEALARFGAANPGAMALGEAWLDAKRAAPERSFWSLARELKAHDAALAELRAYPERWYSAVSALRVMVAWRRYFWPTWLSRRVDVGVYGSNAREMGIAQRLGAAEWVPYERQAEVYALGRVAMNVNAAHDEEGLTHKPFQIAASGVGMVHHSGRELAESFEPGREVAVFARGPELLEAVRSARGMGEAARERVVRDHGWEERLERMLGSGSAPETALEGGEGVLLG